MAPLCARSTWAADGLPFEIRNLSADVRETLDPQQAAGGDELLLRTASHTVILGNSWHGKAVASPPKT